MGMGKRVTKDEMKNEEDEEKKEEEKQDGPLTIKEKEKVAEAATNFEADHPCSVNCCNQSGRGGEGERRGISF